MVVVKSVPTELVPVQVDKLSAAPPTANHVWIHSRTGLTVERVAVEQHAVRVSFVLTVRVR